MPRDISVAQIGNLLAHTKAEMYVNDLTVCKRHWNPTARVVAVSAGRRDE